MTTVLSHEAFHESVGFAFGELRVLEQMSQLPADGVLRVLQSIPAPLLLQALAGRHAAASKSHTIRNSHRPGAAGEPGDRRAAPRRKVLRGGQVIVPPCDGRTILEVQVRDISDGGCRIWSRKPSEVPDHFTIRIVGVCGERRCDVRWRSGDEIGVQFLASP